VEVGFAIEVVMGLVNVVVEQVCILVVQLVFLEQRMQMQAHKAAKAIAEIPMVLNAMINAFSFALRWWSAWPLLAFGI